MGLGWDPAIKPKAEFQEADSSVIPAAWVPLRLSLQHRGERHLGTAWMRWLAHGDPPLHVGTPFGTLRVTVVCPGLGPILTWCLIVGLVS